MSNPDNIAASIAAAGEKAATQETVEQTKAKNAEDTAAVDKVAAVEEGQVAQEDAGLTGAARTVAPAVENKTEEKTSKFGQAVAAAVAIVNAYELAMGPTRVITRELIDSEQAKLYLAISAIVKAEDNSDFMGGMEFLFRKFRDTTGAFSGELIRRRVSYMKQPSGDKALSAYMGFLDLLQVFSDPKGRKALWPRFNKKLALEFCPAGEKRQRLESYMARISA